MFYLVFSIFRGFFCCFCPLAMDAKKHTRETIAKQLKAFRKAAGISAKDAAEAIGKKENTVYAWESGQNQPDAETFLALCNLYHADISEFFGTEPTSYSTETQLMKLNFWNSGEKQHRLDVSQHSWS